MRKTIRLTGRRQLPVNAFDLLIAETAIGINAKLSVLDPACLKNFPGSAEIKLRLSENKRVEVLKFGTIATPIDTIQVRGRFEAPSCQIRVSAADGLHEGKLLGSTKSWTYKSDGQVDGILLFQKGPTSPKLWKLDIREEEYPLLLVNENIPEPALWAKANTVFLASILPTVVLEVFSYIFREGEDPEDGWMADWMKWSSTILPSSEPPYHDKTAQPKWIADVIDGFMSKHKFADHVVNSLIKDAS